MRNALSIVAWQRELHRRIAQLGSDLQQGKRDLDESEARMLSDQASALAATNRDVNDVLERVRTLEGAIRGELAQLGILDLAPVAADKDVEEAEVGNPDMNAALRHAYAEAASVREKVRQIRELQEDARRAIEREEAERLRALELQRLEDDMRRRRVQMQMEAEAQARERIRLAEEARRMQERAEREARQKEEQERADAERRRLQKLRVLWVIAVASLATLLWFAFWR